MPVISSFFGIYVRTYFADHGPPHVHVEYQGHEALVALDDGRILAGSLPRKAQAIVGQWCIDRRAALEDNWQRAQALLPLERIAGADHD
jgi:hypothetical protein